MANGGWYGTKEEWDCLEEPLKQLDSELEKFANTHALIVAKNHKDWPERSMRWNDLVECLIQIYLADQANMRWSFWICATQDRDGSRFWKKATLYEGPIAELAAQLPALLETAIHTLVLWAKHPEELEFITKLAKFPN